MRVSLKQPVNQSHTNSQGSLVAISDGVDAWYPWTQQTAIDLKVCVCVSWWRTVPWLCPHYWLSCGCIEAKRAFWLKSLCMSVCPPVCVCVCMTVSVHGSLCVSRCSSLINVWLHFYYNLSSLYPLYRSFLYPASLSIWTWNLVFTTSKE